jgi:hypothetical protein
MSNRKPRHEAQNGTQQPSGPVEIMTVTEVAAWLKIRPRQVERYGIPSIRLGRKTIRYLRADVLAWLESQRTARRGPRSHDDA